VKSFSYNEDLHKTTGKLGQMVDVQKLEVKVQEVVLFMFSTHGITYYY
jgi:hypothetical protein